MKHGIVLLIMGKNEVVI